MRVYRSRARIAPSAAETWFDASTFTIVKDERDRRASTRRGSHGAPAAERGTSSKGVTHRCRNATAGRRARTRGEAEAGDQPGPARREPGQRLERSTGPRSPEGKAVSKLNGLVHGMRAESDILPGEDPAELDRRIAAWADELGAETEAGALPRRGRRQGLVADRPLPRRRGRRPHPAGARGGRGLRRRPGRGGRAARRPAGGGARRRSCASSAGRRPAAAG